jgi:uncharacterized protein YacL
MNKDLYQNILGTAIGVILMIVLALLFTIDIPQNNMNVLLLIIGALISSFTTVVQYYFGSSKGSADKDKIMRNKEE